MSTNLNCKTQIPEHVALWRCLDYNPEWHVSTEVLPYSARVAFKYQACVPWCIILGDCSVEDNKIRQSTLKGSGKGVS